MPKWVLIAICLFMLPLVGVAATIMEVQGWLLELDYQPGVADGKWGGKTRNALKKFQTDHAMPRTGKMDKPTVKALQASVKAKTNPPSQPEPAQLNAVVAPVTTTPQVSNIAEPIPTVATPIDHMPEETIIFQETEIQAEIEAPPIQTPEQQPIANTPIDLPIEPPMQDVPPRVAAVAAILQPAEPWQGTVITSPAGMKFSRIPGGCFTINDNGSVSDRKVCVHKNANFLLSQYEITQTQWRSLMGNNPSASKQGENYPVENVSWHDTQNFIAKLNAKGQGEYRLPTEAEWEYAARGGRNTMYWWGNVAPICKPGQPNGANFSGGPSCPNATVTVGTYESNPFGLYDVHGNVWEWVQDIYIATSYDRKHQDDPVVTTGGTFRVFRGGSWLYPADAMTVFNRDRAAPEFRFSHLGFRLIYEPNN